MVTVPRLGAALANAVLVQPDGRIVAVSDGEKRIVVIRVTGDGALDPTFSGNGSQSVTFPADRYSQVSSGDLALLPNGKILVAAQVDPWAAVVRLRPDGALDPTFAGGGRKVIRSLELHDPPRVALQPDGRIVLAAFGSTATSNSAFLVGRLTARGNVDRSFSGDGRVAVSTRHGAAATPVVVEPDGHIVVAWSMSELARFGPHGARGGGPAAATTDTAMAMARQPDGALLVAGSRYRNNAVSGVLLRFEAG